jgi:transposase
MPQCSDLFGAKGVSALKKLRLSEPDATLLKEDLELLQLVKEQIKAQEGRIVLFNEGDEATGYLQSIPGMGKILAAVAAGRDRVRSHALVVQPNSVPMRG